MATQTSWVAFKSDTDANFRAWIQAINDAFLTAGWVRSADAGQINLATVLKPDAISQSRGFQIWHMADALQATAPVLLKIEYGSHNSTIAIPAIWITIGTGSNGAGVLTGVATTRKNLQATTAISGGTPDGSGNYKCIFSGTTSRFCMIMGLLGASLSSTITWGIERTKETDGTDSLTGALGWGNVGVGRYGIVAPQVAPVPAEFTDFPVIVPSTGNGQKGPDVVYYPMFHLAPEMMNPGRNFLAYFNGDVPADTVAPVVVYGAPQTMYHVGQRTPLFSFNSALALAMRWE